MLKQLLLMTLFIGSFPMALAHDPGISRARVDLHELGLTIHMDYAGPDLEALLAMDGDFDGRVTATEFSRASSRLQSNMARAVAVRSEGELIPPGDVQLERVSTDAVKLVLGYTAPRSSELSIEVPLLSRLPRGHRQYLTVQDQNGQLRSQHILAAESPPVLIRESDNHRLHLVRDFLFEGVRHIWIGPDHILFLVTLLLPAVLLYRAFGWAPRQELWPAITDTVKVVTAFTVAHSITLALAVLGAATPPQNLVEPIIAFSVLFTAVNNLRPVFRASRWLLAFGFGLIHGFGLAGVLIELDLPENGLVLSLFSFNLGVEVGQLAIVLLVFPVAAALRNTPLYRHWIFRGGSAAAALIAFTWMVERISDSRVLGI